METAIRESLKTIQAHSKSKILSNFEDISNFYCANNMINKNWILTQEGSFMEQDSGKLTLPREPAIFVVSLCWALFQKIIDEHFVKFIECKNHLSLIHKISCFFYKVIVKLMTQEIFH